MSALRKEMCCIYLIIFLFAVIKIGSISVPPSVYKDAEFAVEELRTMSDSGVYSTLSLVHIHDYEEIDGIYHHNTALELELRSEYFKSGFDTEMFNMVVMKHKKENVTTLAIDEFPVMSDDAIEKFYIEKVEENRANREKAFEQLYLQSLKSEPSEPSVSTSEPHKDTESSKPEEIQPTKLTLSSQINKAAKPEGSPVKKTPPKMGPQKPSPPTSNAKETINAHIDTNGNSKSSTKTENNGSSDLEGMTLQELHSFLSNPKTTTEYKKRIQQFIKLKYSRK